MLSLLFLLFIHLFIFIPPLCPSDNTTALSKQSIDYIAKNCSTIVTMLPNDKILEAISQQLISANKGSAAFTHVSCSTISPLTGTVQTTYPYHNNITAP